MSFFGGGFDKQKLSANLMAAKHRIRLHHEKRRNEIERVKKEIGQLVGLALCTGA